MPITYKWLHLHVSFHIPHLLIIHSHASTAKWKVIASILKQLPHLACTSAAPSTNWAASTNPKLYYRQRHWWSSTLSCFDFSFDLRNIGSQKYWVSESSGIRNIRIKFRLKYFIIYFYHYFFLTKPQYVFDFWSLDQSRSQNIRVLNLISATVYSRIPN